MSEVMFSIYGTEPTVILEIENPDVVTGIATSLKSLAIKALNENNPVLAEDYLHISNELTSYNQGLIDAIAENEKKKDEQADLFKNIPETMED